MISDVAHLTSFGIEFQTEEATENERSSSDALLCAGLSLRLKCRDIPGTSVHTRKVI